MIIFEIKISYALSNVPKILPHKKMSIYPLITIMTQKGKWASPIVSLLREKVCAFCYTRISGFVLFVTFGYAKILEDFELFRV